MTRVTSVPLSSIGSDARISDFIPIPVWLKILQLMVWGCFRHYRMTLSVLTWFYIWVWWDFVWWAAVGVAILCVIFVGLLWFAIMSRRVGWIGLERMWFIIYRLFLVNRRWTRTLFAAGIGGDRRHQWSVPKIRFLRVTERGIEGRVNTGRIGVPVTALQDERVIDSMRAAMAASAVRIKPLHMGKCWVEIMWTDAITGRIIQPETLRMEIGTGEQSPYVPFGVDDDSVSVALRPDRSLLIVGESGSGKSSIIWALIRGLKMMGKPFKLYVADPKGGIELGAMNGWRHTIQYASSTLEVPDMVTSACREMHKRLAWMKSQHIRRLEVSKEHPLVIILIDEMLLVSKLWKDGFDSPLGQLLTQGRAAGFAVWGCSQAPQKDVLGPLRDAFVQRMCMAVRSSAMTDAVLGDGAERDGAKCSQISLATPGIGYMYVEGQDGYTRFRAVYINDDEIQRITDQDVRVPLTAYEEPDYETVLVTD